MTDRAPAFEPTRWTLVLRAQGQGPESRQALGDLCETYWKPVHRFLCSEGRTEDAARELTQDFFARLLAGQGVAGVDPQKGRFRSYLLGALKHYLADARDRERRLKRGAGQTPQPLDSPSADGDSPALQVPDPFGTPPDAHFDRAWALALMERTLSILCDECTRQGKSMHFEALKPWLAGEANQLSQAEAADQLGLTEGALKVAIHRLRKRYRELVRSELAQTVATSADIDGELRYLVEVLTRG